ncbi:hypothetical protein L2E82_30049 [Cichorium intybus]|uniref:Uncharacterized protein n=1 Tax=Cichorium intybus TaxID=13427 RepID=A0ACB9CZA9_CICIN|nr:hypothetical protein L2E82_30049 [Cichorium intybus]
MWELILQNLKLRCFTNLEYSALGMRQRRCQTAPSIKHKRNHGLELYPKGRKYDIIGGSPENKRKRGLEIYP